MRTITKQVELDSLSDRRDAIRAELATMPRSKTGTAWHTDRVDALWTIIHGPRHPEPSQDTDDAWQDTDPTPSRQCQARTTTR
jgi:hypothetical protein